MKITFFETPPAEQETLTRLLPGAALSFHEEKLTIENCTLAEDAEIISVFINSRITKELLEKLPAVKFITTRSTGFDHVDVAACTEKRIVVSNVPAYGSETVAEYAFALLLSLSRKVFDACHQIKETAEFSIEGFRGFDLSGKTIGVIGTGRIGKNAIRIANGFGMKVVAYDMHPDAAYASANSVAYMDLPQLLAASDVITIHAPYTKETHHLINKAAVGQMKKGVYIINTARGEIIDTEALVWGLEEKIIAGAGLDVLEGEREIKEEMELIKSPEVIANYKILLEDHLLMKMPQVIVTPHIAFYSKEAEESILETTAANINGFIAGTPANTVK